jgi:hypothetical protein
VQQSAVKKLIEKTSNMYEKEIFLCLENIKKKRIKKQRLRPSENPGYFINKKLLR